MANKIGRLIGYFIIGFMLTMFFWGAWIIIETAGIKNIAGVSAIVGLLLVALGESDG